MSHDDPRTDPLRGADRADAFEDLLRRSRDGDPQALGQLLENSRDYLLLVANRDLDNDLHAKLGSSDLVQQSMLQAQQRLGQFRGQTAEEFRGWLRAILQSDLADARRRFKKTARRSIKRESSLNDSQQHLPPPVDRQHTPRTNAWIQEQAKILRKGVASLSQAHQDVIQRRNFEEKTFEEIGRELNCSADAARKMWYRAILRLQSVLGNELRGEDTPSE